MERKKIQIPVEKQTLFVSPNTPVQEAIASMSQQRVSCALVVENQRLIGIVTERDVVKIAAAAISTDRLTVSEIANREPISIVLSPDSDIFAVLSLLRQHQIRHLPALDENGNILGAITQKTIREALEPTDLLKLKQVHQVMSSGVIHAQPTASLWEIAHLMATHSVSCIVIATPNPDRELLPLGIITERDIVQFRALELNFSEIEAREAMSAPLLPIEKGDSLWCAHQLMKRHRIRRLVVVNKQGNIVGILTQSNLLDSLDPVEIDSTLEILRQQVDKRVIELNQINDRLQEEIAFRERELEERDRLQRKLKIQNARLQAEIRDRQRMEEALAKREREFRALVENAPDPIWRFDRHFRYLYANPSSERIFGISRRSLFGKTCAEVGFDREFVSQWMEALEKACENRTEQTLECKVAGVSGMKWFCARIVPELRKNGEVESILAIARDISDRKQQEESLRLIVEGTASSTGENFFYSCTRYLAQVLQVQYAFISEPIDRPPTKARSLAFWNGESHCDNFEYQLSSIPTAAIAKEPIGFSFEPLQFLCPAELDVLRFNTSHKLEIPLRDSQGNIIGILGIFDRHPLKLDPYRETILKIFSARAGAEIERKQTEKALESSQYFIQKVADSYPDFLYVFNVLNYEFIYSNRSLWELQGYTTEQSKTMGKPRLDELIHPDDFQRIPKILEEYARYEEGEIFEQEYRMKNIRGEWRIFGVRELIFAKDAQGKVIQTLGSATDITERKQAEMAIEQQLKREQLLSAIQNRIRSSLNLEEILITAAREVRQFLSNDRVLIYQVSPDGRGCAVTESVDSRYPKIVDTPFPVRLVSLDAQSQYEPGQVLAIEDIEKVEIPQDVAEFLRQFQVKAKLVIPIIIDDRLWGFSIAHHCQSPRKWEISEIESLCYIAGQLAIAIQQSTLFEQVKTEPIERRKAEKALEASQRFVERIADTSPNLLYIYDLLEQQNVYVNREIAAMLGYSPEEIRQLGTHVLPGLIHPDDFATIPEHFERLSRTKEGEILELEYRMRNSRGEWRNLLARETIFARTDDGKAKQLLGTATDITELKQKEAALRESAEREKAIAAAVQRIRQSLDLETIFATTTEELQSCLNCDIVSIYRFNSDYTGKFVAEAIASPELSLLQQQNRSLQLSAHPDPQVSCRMQVLLSAQNAWQDTYLIESEGSGFQRNRNCLVVEDIYQRGFDPCYLRRLEEFNVRAYIIVPIFCGSKLWGLLAVYESQRPRAWQASDRNIVSQIGNHLGVALQQAELLEQTKKQSEALQKAAVAADAANRAKSEFLASMSHELRTPLNAILGFTQLMNRDKTINSEQQEKLKIINRAGEHLLNLINDILEMSKIESGRTPLNLAPVNLAGILKNLQEMLTFQAQSKGLQLLFDLAPDLPQGAIADESKLRQVLINILGNAIKFTAAGRVSLRLRVSRDDRPNADERDRQSTLCFEIEDSGPGIAPEEMKDLFEPFSQTETGRKSQQGTGLGLPISRKFVQLMGGDLQVRSTIGVGSTFSFTIPITETDAIKRRETVRKPVRLASDREEYRILVVDDNSDSRQFLATLLTAIGFQVREAKNGREGVAIWSTWQPQLICMDMRMPVLDGYEATKQIKASQNGWETAIVALTASAFDEEKQVILSTGCDDFLCKPFREEVLLEKIATHLGISYIYEEENQPRLENVHSLENPLTFDQLKCYIREMPNSFLAELYQAASQGDDDAICTLIDTLPSERAPLANALRDLAHNFEFETIIELAQQSGR